MALLDYSDDFNLDDDGILRDSKSSVDGFLIDDDGIVRDDFDTNSRYTGTGHWTDSGLGGDKQSAGGSTSTLRQLDLHSYPSFEDVSHHLEESHVNISDFEASKDELSFDRDSFTSGLEHELDFQNNSRGNTPQHFRGHYSGRSSRSSFDHSLNFEDTDNKDTLESGKELFDKEYYEQLQELGVIIDAPDVELSNKDSLHEFETVEAHVSHELIDFNENEIEGDPIQEFLRRTPTREVRERRASDAVVPDLYSHHSNRHAYEDEAHAGHTRPNTASSTRTISSRSFPEISPEEALQLYQEQVESQDRLDQGPSFFDNDAESIEFEQSQKTGDDDELFLITGRISDAPVPAKIPAYENDHNTPSQTPRSGISSRGSNKGHYHGDTSFERKVHSRSPAQIHDRSFDRDASFRSQTPYSVDGSVTPVSVAYSDSRPPTRSDSDTPFRPESAASNRSAASEGLGARPKTASAKNYQQSSQKLGKARSQESFFENGKTPNKKNSDKMPKRLLPKPSAPDENQSFRVKSKSTTNISTKPGPVKPTHMSVSDIPHINIEDPDQSEIQSTTSEKSRTELASKLNQEFSKRKQATELVKQLQLDYDKLLSKYATAELTIDQLRLGARISLHSNSPTPSQATSGSFPPAQRQESMMVNQSMSRGMKSPSPFQGSLGTMSPQSIDSINVEYNGRDGGPRRDSFFGDPTMVTGNVGPPQQRTAQEIALSTENGAESVKIGLMFQARSLDDRMESFKTLLDEQHLTHEEQEKVFDKIRTDHEKLRRDYLQSKEDYNVLKRSNANMTDVNFDQEKELEGELFRLGMKFDDIHEKVDENMKEKSSQRQPFQANQASTGTGGNVENGDLDDRAIDQMKRKMKGTKAGDDLLHPRDDEKLNQGLARLHDEYNALMDRYRRLKQMAQTPERDQEIDNLVRKLRHICDEEPVVFKMPRELQERWEQLQEQDEENRLRRGSDTSSSGYRGSKKDVRGKDTDDRRGRGSQNSPVAGTSSQYNGDLPSVPYQQNLHSHHNDSSSSFSSRGWSPRDDDRTFDPDSPGPNLPRPRRHDHPDRERKLKKRPEAGSLSSLQDSGISEHEGGGGAMGGALSNLPGPGKFKEMTKQRNAPDADSGFIGSMVGSEVSQRGSSSRQPSLRLRQPDDTQNRRPSSRPSSVASNRSSRSNREDRPPSRGSIKGGNQRDHAGQTRDYTDDSYTLTESDMSFEADNRPRKSRSSLKARRSPGVIEHTIEEEDEDRPRQRQTQHSPRQEKTSNNRQKETQRGDKIMTPRKQSSSKSQTNVSASSGSVFLDDDDLTPRPTPNQSFNETRELFSSEDEPRQVQSQSVQRLEAQKAATVSRPSEDRHRPPTPGSKIEHRPPTPRITTPVKSRQELENERKMYEDRAVGSDSDDTLEGSEHGTAATRGSNASSQFRILQDEIGRLREEFQKATQQQQVPQVIQPPPPPPPQATNNDRDYFFDPTEDPYAFMQGPRRRANSFSGAVTRDYDDWWKYPLQNPHNEEIPLGYAAADSYATPRIVSTERSQETPSRARRRERLRNRYRRTAEHEVQTANGYDSDQSPTRLPAASTMTDEQLMDYYVPRYTTTQTQQSNIDQQVPHYMSPAPVRLVQRYSSQPNLSQNTRRPSAASQPQGAYAATPQYQNIPVIPQQTTTRPQRRFQRRSIYRTPNIPSQRQYSQDDIDVQGYQPVTYVLADQVPVEGQGHTINGQVYTETSACPMCGGSGYHTHGDYVHEVPVSGPVYVLESPQRARPRGRSKSATRYRHYSPDGRRQARYRVREYRSESSSAESDDTEIYRNRRRSRSAGRQRSRRRYRKYRKDSDFEDALNESLNLSEDIDGLTRKMMRTVKSELGKSKRRKEFGSSIW